MKIEAKYLSQVYRDGTYGLDDFSVNINSGDFVTVVGESGCGKTTLLRVLSGLEKIAYGELYMNGIMSSDIPLKQRKTSLVFQDYALYPRFTVWENLQTALERYDLPAAEENKRIKRALRDFDLLDVAGQLPRSLSGGQQQRVALAKAVVTNPELLLFDEPLSNVAEKQRAGYMQLLKDLKQRLPKTTFVYVTHNSAEALTLGNKLLVMKNGKALQYGEPAFVASNPYSLDVLQTLFAAECTDCKLVDGKVVIDYISVAVNAPNQNVKAAYNPFTKEYCIFDEQGNNLIGQPRYLALNATYDGKTIKTGNLEISTDRNFEYRYIGTGSEMQLYIPTDSISDSDLYGYIALPIENSNGNLFTICGTTVRLDNVKGTNGKVYFPFDCAFCVQNGVRVFAHYRVYDSKCAGKIYGNRLHMPCGSVPFAGKNGKAEVTLKGGARASVSDKGLKFECLSEDDFGAYRLAHCRVKGFDNYVTLNVGKSKMLSKSKAKIQLNPDDITVKYI